MWKTLGFQIPWFHAHTSWEPICDYFWFHENSREPVFNIVDFNKQDISFLKFYPKI